MNYESRSYDSDHRSPMYSNYAASNKYCDWLEDCFADTAAAFPEIHPDDIYSILFQNADWHSQSEDVCNYYKNLIGF